MEPHYAGLFTSTFVEELRTNLDNAAHVLHGLDNGNIMISRCRDCLKRLLDIYDSLHTSRSPAGELAIPGRLPDLSSRSNLPPTSQATTMAGLARQNGSYPDFVTPMGWGDDNSPFDVDMGFGSLGGLVMSSDFEFLNRT